jgi:hypothetical protein
MHFSSCLAAVALLLAAWLTLGTGPGDATADGRPLFLDPTGPPTLPLPDAPRILRARYVEVDFGALGGEPLEAASASSSVQLNPFPDATFAAERDRAEPTGSGHGVIWTGHLAGVPNSAVTLVAEDGVLVGNVQAAGQYYEVRYAGEGLHTVAETNPRAFGPD